MYGYAPFDVGSWWRCVAVAAAPSLEHKYIQGQLQVIVLRVEQGVFVIFMVWAKLFGSFMPQLM